MTELLSVPRTLGEIDFLVVDTETTGGSATANRVIDVAVFHVRDGIILDRFHSLVNPGRPIPGWITMLTGIDDAMVKDAPRFEDIAGPLAALLGRGVFAAHNAGFDFNFLKCEFERAGRRWDAEALCTVRLARHLLPDLPSRSLGALCDHLLIDIENRHRAHGDAEATVYVLKHLLQLARREHRIEHWEDLQAFLQTGPLDLPAGISPSFVHALPEGPGHFVLRDVSGEPVCKGRTTNLRRRIRAFFRKGNRSEKSTLYRQVVRSIDAFATTPAWPEAPDPARSGSPT